MSVASRRRARGMWLLSGFGGGGGGSEPAPSYDTDAQTYITAVEAADGQSLETGVKDAINAFVVGCKSDGIWTAIKASCILAGARTLTGALVPLVGTAPTNNNFVSGDYDRETGLVGDGSTKYLDSNRNNNADPQNSNHNAVYVTAISSETNVYIGADPTTASNGTNNIGWASGVFARNRCNTTSGYISTSNSAGLHGTSRSTSSAFTGRSSGINKNVAIASQTPYNANLTIFASGGTSFRSPARLAFYSIGESLDLALLDTRVTTLITNIGTALA